MHKSFYAYIYAHVLLRLHVTLTYSVRTAVPAWPRARSGEEADPAGAAVAGYSHR